MTTPQSQPTGYQAAPYAAPPAGRAPVQPGYGPPGYAPARPGWNVLAIVALVSAFFVPLVAVALGWVSVRQIARTGEQGKPLAITALVLGGIGCAFWVLFWVLIISGGGSFSYSI